MVFYRKYRPQKIEDLDSEEIREKLHSVFSGKNIPHAFLFTGPKGLGKTSAARIVAKVVNCEKKSTQIKSGSKTSIEPCNKCLQCTSITNGTNMDVLEIDGASNRGIDEIRDLREKIRLLPAGAFRKVYIIDEVHMLTTEAFNALLKTLEEPPIHALFILCTTEPQKVPGTITSRCFHIAFKRATEEELMRSFIRITKGEKINTDKEALLTIAKLADGSFRDGVKILEELTFSAGRRKITKKQVEEKYQFSGFGHQVSQMTTFLSEKNTKGALKLIAALVEQGMDMKFFIGQLIEELHKILLAEVGIEGTEHRINQRFSLEDIKKIVELLVRASSELKYAVLPQLPLEIAIIEWGEDDAGRLSHAAEDTQQTSIVQKKISPPSLSERRPLKAGINSDNLLRPAFSSSAGLRLRGSDSRSGQPSSIKANNFWQELLEKVKPYNHSVAGVLRGCRLEGYDGKKLVIQTGYKFHKERLEDKKVLEMIEKVCKEITRKNVEVLVHLKDN